MMKIIDINTWNRKEHFEFFRHFDEPFYGGTMDVDVTLAYQKCKKEGVSFYLYYLYCSVKAVNEIEELRYRIQGDQVVCFDAIHVASTVLREDKTFSFSFFEYQNTFKEFQATAIAEIKRVQASTGLGMDKNGTRVDTVHYSAVPWMHFKGVSHARNFKYVDSAPKICFGKIAELAGKKIMPTSIHAHHALVDGYHVGLYCDRFQELLNK